MELLSPAGSFESLIAAVQNGADAVYFGGAAFNARRLAKNFDSAELERAVDYCRLRGAKVYITLNTLLTDRELGEALNYAAELYRLGVDAVIVQDIGLAGLLHRQLPELTLHASTQMGIHDLDGALTVQKLGMCRAVLSRETSLEAIRHIADNCTLELEAFAHGALCMSFSGGCLFSSMAGERSGNRGTCAQPCRKRMAVNDSPGTDDYALSLSDLCMLSHIADMEAAGVCCIKLEGRMKRPEYVAAATHAYRLAMDGDTTDPNELLREIRRIFDRGARTGYYYGDGAVTDCVAQSRGEEDALKRAQLSYAEERRARPLDMHLYLRAGEPAQLHVSSNGTTAELIGGIAQTANKPQSGDVYLRQLEKLGGTAFQPGKCSVDAGEDAYLPAAEINAMRREACLLIAGQLTQRRVLQTAPILPALSPMQSESFKICVQTCTLAQAKAALDAGADELALAPWDYAMAADMLEALQKYRDDAKLLLSLPAVVMAREERDRLIGLLHSGLVDGGIASNIGQTDWLEGLTVHLAGTQLNSMNSYSVRALYAMGYTGVLLSQELTKPQINDILKHTTAGVRIYGRTELMQLCHCTVKEHLGCMGCTGNSGTLVDEAGRRFPLVNVKQTDGCLVKVLNCVPTDICDLYGRLPLDRAQLVFWEETPEQTAERVRAAVLARAGTAVTSVENATRGHWTRAVD